MANPATQPQQAARPGHPNHLLRLIGIVMLALVVLVGIAVLITWLVIKPKALVYTVEDGSVRNFNLTHDHLNATFDFAIRSYNPNSRISVYYDTFDVSVEYDDQIIAFNMVDPFLQPHRNVTRLEVKVTAQNVTLLRSISRNLRLEKASGEIELTLLLNARVRFKVGRWKSQDRSLRISCSHVLMHFSRFKNFERIYCDVEL